MSEIHGKSEICEMKMPEAFGFQEIKPKTDMLLSEAIDFVKSLFNEVPDIDEGYYDTYEIKKQHTSVDGERGHWDGERGESKYIPSDETDSGKVVIEKLAEKEMDGIEYRNAEPDFSKCAEVTVEIDNMTEHRVNYCDTEGNVIFGNFSQADVKCAEQWNISQKDNREDWKPEDVREWRRENGYSWHERCDTRTMDLVPYDIHNYFRHYGGCFECKIRDAVDIGGEFDE